eukprot:gene16080-21838_t
MIFPITLNVQPSTGRGTAGAVISINDSNTNYIITNAHVVFDGLSHPLGEESPEGEASRNAKIEIFNSLNYYGCYKRVKGNDMDFALVPSIESFKKSLLVPSIRLDTETFINFNVRNLFKPAVNLPELWKQLTFPLQVFKRGIATGVTKGLINGIDEDSGCFCVESELDNCFSRPGDSGSLVFGLDDDDSGWFPVGLHYSGGNSKDGKYVSYILPLQKVFQQFLHKNDLQEMKITFVNPVIGCMNIKKIA